MKPIIRYMRMRCANPNAKPEAGSDGVLAVAAIDERAGLARLLLVDMGPWGRNDGASATNAVEQLVEMAHHRLIAGFGVELDHTACAELDSDEQFDLLVRRAPGGGISHAPLKVQQADACPRSRQAFLHWACGVGGPMLGIVEAVRTGTWAGVEG